MATMDRIIDVDAHAEPAAGRLDDSPDLAERLPALLPVFGDDISVSGGTAK